MIGSSLSQAGLVVPDSKAGYFGGLVPFRRASVSGGAFSPASLPGLMLWLDATDASTLFQDTAGTTPATANNDPVGRWNDKSGGGRNVVQGAADQRPILSIVGADRDVSFDGVDDMLDGVLTLGPLAQPMTIYLRVTAHTAGDYIFDHTGGGRVAFGYNVAVGNQYGPFAGVGFGSTVVARQAGLWTIVANGASSTLYLAGVSVGTGNVGANAWGTPRIGANASGLQGAAFMLRALLVYSGAQDAPTRSLVETYLGAI